MPLLRVEEILSLTHRDDRTLRQLIEKLAKLHGCKVYQALFKALFQVDLTAAGAQNHWRAAVRAQERFRRRRNIRALLLEQLHVHENILSDPRIIDASKLQDIQRRAMTDGLTSLYNQTYFKEQLNLQISAAKGQPGMVFSVLLFDLDHFKQYNDRCGHLHGDRALAKAARLICDNLPENGIAARYGGEEFGVILPNTGLLQAITQAENIRAAIEKNHFEGEDRLDSGNLTISGGIAAFPEAGDTPIALIEHADRRLYEAKYTRNQIAPRASDARQITRHAIRNIVEIYDEREGNFKSSLSSDISCTGMLMKSNLSTTVGANVRLRFPFPYWPSEHTADAQICHIRNHSPNGAYMIGVEFNQPQVDFIERILPTENYAPTA